MKISAKAQEFLAAVNAQEYSTYISPSFFDEDFMQQQEFATAKKALVYSALTIAKKVGGAGLFKMTFREAESFLRDDPRESAWEGVLDLKKWFETIILEIQREYFDNALMANKVEISHWSELDLQERILRVELITDNINTSLDELDLGAIELFSIEENEVCVNDLIRCVGLRGPAESALKELIYECISKYINFSFQSRLIKLVAQ